MSTTSDDSFDGWRHHAPDLVIGIALAALGVAEAFSNAEAFRYVDTHNGVLARGIVLALVFAAAGGLYRKAPGLSLLLIWMGGAFQLVTSTNLMLVEAAVLLVSFGAARFGQTSVLWLSGLSMPLGALSIVALTVLRIPPSADIFDGRLGALIVRLVGPLSRSGAVLSLAFLAFCLIALPWLAGLALRLRTQSVVSREARIDAEEARVQAIELAAVREEQAQLARDVHDVVGHSLAVILAQAESAQFLPDDQPEDLKDTLATIARSARTSLGDVRQVLTTGVAVPPPAQTSLATLIEGVQSSGHIVESSVFGSARPQPPELQVVTYRVLQEMLTNAIKHGRRDRPIVIAQHWGSELRLEVTNAVAPRPGESRMVPGGLGLNGMRTRLESVGGRLEIRPELGGAQPIWTAVAIVPIRSTEARLA